MIPWRSFSDATQEPSVKSFLLTMSYFLFAFSALFFFFCYVTYFLCTTPIKHLLYPFFFLLPQLYSKLRCDDQPILEHVEQLLSELGGEMEGEEEEPVLDDDYEPCSDDEEDDAEAPMEH